MAFRKALGIYGYLAMYAFAIARLSNDKKMLHMALNWTAIPSDRVAFLAVLHCLIGALHNAQVLSPSVIDSNVCPPTMSDRMARISDHSIRGTRSVHAVIMWPFGPEVPVPGSYSSVDASTLSVTPPKYYLLSIIVSCHPEVCAALFI